MGTKALLSERYFRTFEHVYGITNLPKPIRHPTAVSRDVNVAWAIDTLTGAAVIQPLFERLSSSSQARDRHSSRGSTERCARNCNRFTVPTFFHAARAERNNRLMLPTVGPA